MTDERCDEWRADPSTTESEAKYRALVEQIPAVTYLAAVDDASTTLYVSPQIERFIGYRPEEYQADPDIWRERLHPDDYERVMTEVRKAHVNGEPFQSEYRMIARDGSVVWFRDEARIVHNDAGQPIVLQGVMFDITGRKLAEDNAKSLQRQLEHLSRVAVVGEMAGMLAHELSQPLTAIGNYATGCTKMLQTGRADEAAVVDVMAHITNVTTHAATIMQRIRRLIRRGGPERSAVNIGDLVRQLVGLIEPECEEHGICLELHLNDDSPSILGDPIGLQQVVLNLVRNAIEAVNQADSDRREVTISNSWTDTSVELTIHDTGVGLPEQRVEELFEPFATTKVDGLGLGLAISSRIIKDHGGRLWAQPNPDGGASFTSSLPRGRS